MIREATQPTAMPSSADDRDRQARPWRILSTTSGLLLAATFFLPAIPTFGIVEIPVEIAFELVEALVGTIAGNYSLVSVDLYLLHVGLYVPAYLLGFLIALYAISRMIQAQWLSRLHATAIALLILGDCLLLLAVLLINIIEGGLPTLQEIYDLLLFFVGYLFAPLLVLAYMVATILLRPLRFISHIFIATLAACFWFGYWLTQSSTIGYGVYVSFIASWLLLLSSIGEARALTGQSWRRTVWLLLTCRLRKRPDGHCPQCDYYLFGLTVMRCPECGRPFNFEELGMSPDQLGFSGLVDHVASGPGYLVESE